MKLVILLSLIFSTNVFAQSTKATRAIILESASISQSVKKNKDLKEKTKVLEEPCDSKEDLLKRLEAEKKAKEAEGKGFSLQGKKDAGCSL